MKSLLNSLLSLSLLVCLFALSSCSSSVGENDGGADIYGKIMNEHGDATSSIVEILELDQSTSTDENGNYSFLNIDSGEYTLLTRSKNLIPAFVPLKKDHGIQVKSDVRLKSGSSFSGGGYEFNMGQSHSIGNVTVSFSEVSSDSRCAVDATCVWEGSGRVALNLESNGQNLSVFVDTNDLNDFSSTVEALGLVIRLNQLSPLPELGGVIQQSEYSINVEID